ncbi:MAG: N-6 DNA methylase, partial [Candidatus Bipolaricaulota bacterium]|nr:N-6 DNA methylase [Candidatus Bipolaricaulota bacterium]
DCVLAPTRAEVLRISVEYKDRLENPDQLLRNASGFAFYNTSQYDFEKLLADAPNVAANLRKYISGFSPNMREVVEKFDFDNTISKLDESGLLFKVLERFKNVDLHPDKVDNATMGTIFEELIRKFNEALNENPGEHFTPRDVIHLMVDLMLAADATRISGTGPIRTVYDPCCGSGGMLTIAKEHIMAGISKDGKLIKAPINPQADIHLFGQEVNPETFAICKSDLYMKSSDGHDAENIAYGSTLSNDRHEQHQFDYMITNPPYGKDWKMDQEVVKTEHERGSAGRFGAGLPRISDGQLLFLQHMLFHMEPISEGGSRVAIIMNGSPLFTGGAGSGESEIRRWILENDWLETLVALPEQLFYNTGIATYVWVLTNRKAPERRGKVQLIDATSFWVPMRKSLGNKRRTILLEKAAEIMEIMRSFEDAEHSKIFPTTQFGYRRITVERPLQLNFQASSERIERFKEERAFQKLALSKKHNPEVKAQEEKLGKRQQERILEMLQSMPDTLFKDRPSFEKTLQEAAADHRIKLDAPIKKAILSALSERDETAEICLDKKGNPEPDTNLRDTENVPLSESIESFFEREVKPHVPDAWIDETKRDAQDGKVGIVGYEINFNRYFYTYEPPRPLEEIEADIEKVEHEIMEMLGKMRK